MKIPFNPIINEYNQLETDINEAVINCLKSGWYVLGKHVETFETKFAKAMNTPYCIGVASGVDAITLILMGLGISKGDDVIVPAFTAFPSITGIQRAGATPVLVDVCSKTGLLDPTKIEKAITKDTKAILAVHLYGQCCDLTHMKTIATKHNLKIIEDCAQSTGAKYQDHYAGTHGIAGAFSFYPTKNLSAMGDGGAIITHNKALYEQCYALRNYGQTEKNHFHYQGLNSRLDELQAAILITKLNHLKQWNTQRNIIASYYNKTIKKSLQLEILPYNDHVYHLYVIKTKKRDDLQTKLQEKGIQTLIHYPFAIHQQPAFKTPTKTLFPNAEQLSQSVLSIPNHPQLTKKEYHYIAEQINIHGQ